MLEARTCRLISVRTCASLRIRKCEAPIQALSVANGCHAANGTLARRATVGVVGLEVDEVALVEQADGLVVRGLRLGYQRHDPVLGTAQDLLTLEVATLGQGPDRLADDRLRLLRPVSQLGAVVTDVGDPPWAKRTFTRSDL